jgi:hypothetical protein
MNLTTMLQAMWRTILLEEELERLRNKPGVVTANLSDLLVEELGKPRN